jgi:hypothetical protein
MTEALEEIKKIGAEIDELMKVSMTEITNEQAERLVDLGERYRWLVGDSAGLIAATLPLPEAQDIFARYNRTVEK